MLHLVGPYYVNRQSMFSIMVNGSWAYSWCERGPHCCCLDNATEEIYTCIVLPSEHDYRHTKYWWCRTPLLLILAYRNLCERTLVSVMTNEEKRDLEDSCEGKRQTATVYEYCWFFQCLLLFFSLSVWSKIFTIIRLQQTVFLGHIVTYWQFLLRVVLCPILNHFIVMYLLSPLCVVFTFIYLKQTTPIGYIVNLMFIGPCVIVIVEE